MISSYNKSVTKAMSDNLKVMSLVIINIKSTYNWSKRVRPQKQSAN